MRDAIVFSGTVWESWNVLERFAAALTQLGVRVLYCENPVSRTKTVASPAEEIAPGIYRFRPRIWGHRLNRFSPLAAMQSHMAADQIEAEAKILKLNRPVFIYGYMGRLLRVCHQMQRSGHTLIHVSMDKPQNQLLEHASLAENTLVIPRPSYEELRAQLGDRIVNLPQLGSIAKNKIEITAVFPEPDALRCIPRPRLTYLGVPQARLMLPALREILNAHPEWHFVHFGPPDTLDLSNSHPLRWMSKDDLAGMIAATDIALMPYDCTNEQSLNCVPLKIFDHFAIGTPVVSTPIISVEDFSDVIYLGKDAGELMQAVESALREPTESPKRARRMEIAREHSLENIAAFLGKVLPLDD